MARELLEEAITTEGGDSSVSGRPVYNLPTATTGALSAVINGEELDEFQIKIKVGNAEELKKLKDELEAEYAERTQQLISENSYVLAKLEQKQETGKFLTRASFPLWTITEIS